MANGPYSRVYHSIVDDPMFERVIDNDHALSTWLRMLLIADAMYPTSAPMPPRNPTVRLLIDCGLVIQQSGNRYSIRGLKAERERRSDAGRNAAAVRWQSVRNADSMPRRDETRKEEKSNGQSPRTPAGFLGFPPKAERAPGEAYVPRHDGQEADCEVCKAIREGKTTTAAPYEPRRIPIDEAIERAKAHDA